MATDTTTSPLQFKSYKGGERRAEGADGSLYSIKRVGDDTFETSVRMPGEKKFNPLGGGNAKAARLLADQHYTNPDEGKAEALRSEYLAATPQHGSQDDRDEQIAKRTEGRAPTFVQEGSGTETVAQVLQSIPNLDTDAEIADVRRLLDATHRAANDDAMQRAAADAATSVLEGATKASKRVDDKAKRAAQKSAKAQATKKAKASEPQPSPVGKLVFEPFKGDEDDQRAKGARHAYKITHAMSGGFFAQQRTCSWTNIAGKADTFEQAEHLANLYEQGVKQLSHRKFVGLPYAKAIALLDDSK